MGSSNSSTEETRSGNREVEVEQAGVEVEVKVYNGRRVRICPMYVGISVRDRLDGVVPDVSDPKWARFHETCGELLRMHMKRLKNDYQPGLMWKKVFCLYLRSFEGALRLSFTEF